MLSDRRVTIRHSPTCLTPEEKGTWHAPSLHLAWTSIGCELLTKSGRPHRQRIDESITVLCICIITTAKPSAIPRDPRAGMDLPSRFRSAVTKTTDSDVSSFRFAAHCVFRSMSMKQPSGLHQTTLNVALRCGTKVNALGARRCRSQPGGNGWK